MKLFKPTGGVELQPKRVESNKYEEKEKNIVFTAIDFDNRGQSPFAKPGELSINIFCMLEPSKRFCYLYILRDESNPLIKEFEDNKEEFSRELRELKYFDKFVYLIEFVDSEEDLIETYWLLHRIVDADISLSWGGLDVQYPALINRMEKLNINKSIACDPKYKKTILEIVEDKSHKAIDHYDRRIFLSCMSDVNYRDQLKDYINSHRYVQPPKTFMLHDVVEHETDYRYTKSNIDVDIESFAQTHFKEFVFNIIEVVITQYELYKSIQKGRNI